MVSMKIDNFKEAYLTKNSQMVPLQVGEEPFKKIKVISDTAEVTVQEILNRLVFFYLLFSNKDKQTCYSNVC